MKKNSFNASYLAPKYQNFHIEGVEHICPEDAFQELKNEHAVLIDVRELVEFEKEKFQINNVLHFPMSRILDLSEKIPKDKNIIVACRVGERSTKIVNLLKIKDFPNVVNLDGGLNMWKLFGMPIDVNNGTNTCGCCGNQCK
jgi:rhodanese-related sulfurtransferase